MKTALIGFTGFVGSNIAQQYQFSDYYNSQNISKIHLKKYDLIVSCATSSVFWKANLEPGADWLAIQKLMSDLATVKADQFVLISTIFVYPKPYNVSEDSIIDPNKLTPYGLHRYKLEQFIQKKFKKSLIIRLPNLFGQNLKKNYIYDLIHHNRWDLTHKDSKMQWYNLEHIWQDLQIALLHQLPIVNFSVAPLSAKRIADFCLGIDFNTVTEKPPLNHRMLTKYGQIFGKTAPFLYSQKETLNQLKTFISKKV
jgi:nucleoside-diphosphate-sugar epimerase